MTVLPSRRVIIVIPSGAPSLSSQVHAPSLSSRAERGILVSAKSGTTLGAGKNQDPSRCSG